MSHRARPRSGAFLVGSVLLASVLAACGTREPPPDYNAPPTPSEWRILGVDATDPYFLKRFRRCSQWKSQQLCKKEPYGDDGGSFE